MARLTPQVMHNVQVPDLCEEASNSLVVLLAAGDRSGPVGYTDH